jgi:hypothetical protein
LRLTVRAARHLDDAPRDNHALNELDVFLAYNCTGGCCAVAAIRPLSGSPLPAAPNTADAYDCVMNTYADASIESCVGSVPPPLLITTSALTTPDRSKATVPSEIVTGIAIPDGGNCSK